MSSLSVVISAYNEEKKIAECLESVSFADEIILVDSSSTDSTPTIAKKYKIKYFKRPNNPMLNINKNYGFSQARSDWILSLDADERVSKELQDEIKKAINSDREINGYWIPRKNIIFGKWIEHTGWYPDYQLRLLKRGKGKFAQKHVHEMIDINGATEYLESSLLHYNFETLSQFLYKHIELYAPNEAENLIKKGYKFSYKDAIAMPLAEFLSRFFAREGYKDGLHGLVLSLLLACYHFIIFVTIWEKGGFKPYNSEDFLTNVSSLLKKGSADIAYWIANEKIKRSKSFIETTVLKVQRKITS